MSQQVDQFCDKLRVKLNGIGNGLHDLKNRVDGMAQNVEQDVRSNLDNVNKRIEQGRSKVAAAQADMTNWAAQQKAGAKDKIDEWKAKRETGKLERRADGAEQYAAAAVDVAAAALDEAERATLEAWIARQDADSSRSKQPSHA